MPLLCPSCNNKLMVQSLICENCKTSVAGSFSLPVLANLSNEDQQFIIDFVKTSGSLKDMAGKLGLSYPTVRNKLDELIQKINNIQEEKTQTNKK